MDFKFLTFKDKDYQIRLLVRYSTKLKYAIVEDEITKRYTR